ncbi:hypothetical protein VTI74DRAFT_11414 [Chaetomium olivicolor]
MTPSSNPDGPVPLRYFAFGSNLWQSQMSLRCPASPYSGLGRLRGYKWFINARGYANIAPTSTGDNGDGDDEVWGLVYDLSRADEARLDVNEGVPYAYEKRVVPVEFWPSSSADLEDGVGNGEGKPEVVDMLVYIDFKRNQGGHQPRAEYVHRMNMGIKDAVREGVPQAYVDAALRKYIPPEEEADTGAILLAQRQAAGFKDESGIYPQTGSGVVSGEEEELPERASEVCYMGKFGM